MQELIEKLKSKGGGMEIYLNANTQIINESLEKEKEQMINFAYGFYDECFTKDGIIQKSAGEYYNQTYNQNK